MCGLKVCGANLRASTIYLLDEAKLHSQAHIRSQSYFYRQKTKRLFSQRNTKAVGLKIRIPRCNRLVRYFLFRSRPQFDNDIEIIIIKLGFPN